MCDAPAVAVYNRIVNRRVRLGNDELVSQGLSKAGVPGCGEARRSISKLPSLYAANAETDDEPASQGVPEAGLSRCGEARIWFRGCQVKILRAQRQ